MDATKGLWCIANQFLGFGYQWQIFDLLLLCHSHDRWKWRRTQELSSDVLLLAGRHHGLHRDGFHLWQHGGSASAKQQKGQHAQRPARTGATNHEGHQTPRGDARRLPCLPVVHQRDARCLSRPQQILQVALTMSKEPDIIQTSQQSNRKRWHLQGLLWNRDNFHRQELDHTSISSFWNDNKIWWRILWNVFYQ